MSRKMNIQRHVLDLFKCMVVDDNSNPVVNTDYIHHGIILDFNPTKEQENILNHAIETIAVKTMFSREERDNADMWELVIKQVLHYVEVYGLEKPGIFNLTVENGR